MKVIEKFGIGDVQRLMLKDNQHINFKPGAIKVSNPELIVGIELEMENLPVISDNGFRCNYPGIGFTEDGSLRNYGVEAITFPTKSKYVESFLRGFFEMYGIKEPNNYSERCSTHIHANVQDFTLDQVKALALTYQTLERVLFTFIGEDRENNIFCVPWYQAGFNSNFVNEFETRLDRTIANWIKYTALNLTPISTKGTVEFRHLRGTCDINEIMVWINLIGSMLKYAINNSYNDVKETILNLNTVSNYDVFLEDVFQENAFIMKRSRDYRSMLSLGVVDSKLMLSKKKPNKSLLSDSYVGLEREIADIRRMQNAADGAQNRQTADGVGNRFNWIDEYIQNMPAPQVLDGAQPNQRGLNNPIVVPVIARVRRGGLADVLFQDTPDIGINPDQQPF